MNLPHIVLIYLAVIRSSFARLLPKGRKNVVTFFMYGIDKWKAKKSKWRIRETALLGLAVLGGSIGAWLGMQVWHHKTQHKGGNRDIDNIVGGYQFKYGVPAIIIVQLALIVYFIVSPLVMLSLTANSSWTSQAAKPSGNELHQVHSRREPLQGSLVPGR